MTYRWLVLALFSTSIAGWSVPTRAFANEAELQQQLATIRNIQPQGKGHASAMEAWKTLSTRSLQDVPAMLKGMSPDNDLANNWLRMAIDTVIDHGTSDGQSVPLDAMEQVLADTSNPDRGRELAYEWLTKLDKTAERRWLPKMLNDPSLDLRWKSVDAVLANAKQLQEDGQVTESLQQYKSALLAARNVDQIKTAAQALRDGGEKVDLTRLFGFLTSWHLIGPFDNRDKQGFDRDYPPEGSVDLSATYVGKEDAQVAWKAHQTSDEYGLVDLNEAVGKNMGAAVYAVTTFVSGEAQQVDIRWGSTNANKVWLNGELLGSNHVYHSGDGIDQYVAQGQLKAGQNIILLKVCQNEQTDSWAQDWNFQIRVCDELGTAIHSAK